ncbi:Alginate lyase (modular protein) [Hyella patelloides LEGE 07179]|uniref:Alginate lyase (Modular protein) n=1 Tax=Hyella patelloides LEGE 07179 TaxID=945734 RepID=A0A563VRI6_9CYAN|nr:polysaccharide lyase family 7 protein [Hyella patelloides]VEP14029.1 Alginate lyase (modular protein) [Hyella patelloides LEGE 07179]
MEEKETVFDEQLNSSIFDTFNSSDLINGIEKSNSELALLESETSTKELNLLQTTEFNATSSDEFGDSISGSRVFPNEASATQILVQAEDYTNFSDTTSGNLGSQYRDDDVDIQSTRDIGGGHNVGWIANGEWLEYSVNIPSTTNYQAEARIASPKNGGTFNLEIDGERLGTFSVENTGGWQNWQSLTTSLGSISAGNHTVRVQVLSGEFNLNWVRLSEETAPNPTPSPSSLNPDVAPSGNFDLLDWKLTLPVDANKDGKADEIKESQLSDGFEDSDYFFTDEDGGMVFRSPVAGSTTSQNTKYTRTELREMLRRGDTSDSTTGIGENNWVLSSAPSSAQKAAGGVDGQLTATLAVNHVTTTGDSNQVGRVILGQIHANDDEPLRLYYRKLPDNSKGSIYIAHEPRTGDEQYYELIGSRSSSASNPSDGIAFDEKFSYDIDVEGNMLTVTIMRPGKLDVVQSVDMSDSGYDDGDQYMYFKAGVYNQNNTGKSTDYAQATFYGLENQHNSYSPSAS